MQLLIGIHRCKREMTVRNKAELRVIKQNSNGFEKYVRKSYVKLDLISKQLSD